MGRIERLPSIHITATQLEAILQELEGRGVIKRTYPNGSDPELFIEEFTKLSSLYSIPHRSIIATNQKTKTRAHRVKAEHKENVLLFSKVLHSTRISLKHRGVKMIREGDPDWLSIRDITKNATSFCNEYGLELKQGYQDYIRIAIARLNRYNTRKLVGMHDLILEVFDATLEIQEDLNKATTQAAYQRYTQHLFQKTQMDWNIKETPEKYVFFVKVAQECVKRRVTAQDYIDAQFEALAFVDGIPNPAQLVGAKAIERLAKFMFENTKSKPNPIEEPKIDFSFIKELD